MSIKIVRDQIQKFLNSETPEVMAIKGDWGVGKTYSWKKFLIEYKEEISVDRYSYVSLFGINDLETLKFSIFESSIKKALLGSEASLETFKENTLGIIETLGRKTSGFLGKNPITKGFTPAFESISFLALRKTLICIDDLERKGSKLEVKEILGLISHLKEQKSCKIVLLLNEGEDGLGDYEKYKEKVIDIELQFEPTASECVDIAYDGDNWLIKSLKRLAIQLNIRNIRVLKKIQRLAENCLHLLNEYEEDVRYQVIHSLVLFTWCYYCSKDNDDIPTLEYVTTRGYRSLGFGKKEEKSIKEKNWDSLIHQYGYYLTDELDLEIKRSVLTGYCIEERLLEKASVKNNEAIASKIEGSFNKAWELYHHSLGDNQEEVLKSLYESLINGAKYISPVNLNGTVTLFRDLGENDKANEMIDAYIHARKDTPAIFNLDDMMSNPFSSDIQDAELKKRFNEAYSSSVALDNPQDVILKIAKSNGWNEKDVLSLENTSSDLFYDIIKNINGEILSPAIESVMRLGRHELQNNDESKILRNLTEALKKIGNESEMNKRRVQKYGIEIDEVS